MPRLKTMLQVEMASGGTTVVCAAKGHLDARTATTFRGAVALCLGGPGLIIDLSQTRFIDGSGLTALVGAVRRAQYQRTRVAVVAPRGSIRRVLDDAGLDRIVNVLETVDQALAEIDTDTGTAERIHTRGGSTRVLPSTDSPGGETSRADTGSPADLVTAPYLAQGSDIAPS